MSSAVPHATPLRTEQELADHARLERKARRFWVSLIVGFLGLQVVIGFFSLYVAVGDPSAAVIPNYHQSALDWDVKQRAQQMLVQLGWEISVVATPVQNGERSLQVMILGKNGQRIEHLNVSGKVFHHARGEELHKLRLKETDPGLYIASIPLERRGLWQVELLLEGDHGIASQTTNIEVE
jgi:nitrogen fixation protein FixH